MIKKLVGKQNQFTGGSLFLSDFCCTCDADLKGHSSFPVLSHSLSSFMFVLFPKKKFHPSRIFAPSKYFDMNSTFVQNLDFIWLCCDRREKTKPAVDDCGGGTPPHLKGGWRFTVELWSHLGFYVENKFVSHSSFFLQLLDGCHTCFVPEENTLLFLLNPLVAKFTGTESPGCLWEYVCVCVCALNNSRLLPE